MFRFSSSPRLLAYGCLAASMALVGSYVALSKPLAAVFPVLLLAWLRFGIGALAMLHWLRRPPYEPPMTRQTRWLLFWESFLGNFLFTLCMISGVQLSGAVAAGVIMAAIPAAVALLSWVLLRERVAPQVWAGVACAVLGIGLLAMAPEAAPPAAQASAQARFQAMPHGQLAWLGHLLLLAAVLCEASYAVIGKKLTASLTPRRISALINLWGFVLSLPFGLWLAWGFDFRAVSPGLWLLLVFYALAACMWTVWLWMTGLRSVPAAQAGVFTVFLPISAALVGVLVLGERLSALQWAALGTALLGVVLATWPVRGRGLA
ncbi:DMT family transporter [Vandammella animalimorsus]|uniref:DMT family transporter n=1 Tax=Vandammella animalimorsus TaxID=2029117 RepID=UPI00325B818B